MSASRKRRGAGFATVSLAAACFAVPGAADDVGAAEGDLRSLSLEQLLNVEVSSVSKKSEPSLDAAAAVFVITQDDIRRSGVNSIPEALRLAPGVEVAQIDANKWAIGVRGFGSRLSRSLLVLIDGRSVYSPLFAGVYWEVQDTLLADIDRIEVIRGPAGTTWGANAVNGVVNIITRNAVDTQGRMAIAAAGNLDAMLGLRYGGEIGLDGHYRIYAKAFDREPNYHAAGNEYDDWRMSQMGFRIDRLLSAGDALTMQGDAYTARAGQRTAITDYSSPQSRVVEGDAEFSGFNLLVRHQHRASDALDLRLQSYFDHTDRKELNYSESRDTFDLDFVADLQLSSRHQLSWGGGYRWSDGDVSAVPTIVFSPARRVEQLISAFIQDEFWLVADRLRLTLGIKFEHNDYSGFEYEPNARLLWKVAGNHTLWTAVSHAVRTPSRVEHDLTLTTLIDPNTPLFTRVTSDGSFQSEEVLAYEVGYRAQANEQLFFDVTGFYNRYDELLSLEQTAPFVESDPVPVHTVQPLAIGNGVQGRARGLEFVVDWKPARNWRLHANQSFLWMDFSTEPGSLDTTSVATLEGSSPRRQTLLRSSVEFGRNDFDLTVRHVSELSLRTGGIPAYTAVDMRLARRLNSRLELSLIGRNLFDPHHPEFQGGALGQVEVPRSVMLKLRYDW